MRTDDIAGAFSAIVEEAEKLKTGASSEEIQSGLATIVSIAKHQNDIRHSKKGSCRAKDEPSHT